MNARDGMPDRMTPEAATLKHWVDRAARRMDQAGLHFGHGTAEARDEACWMAASVLDLAPDFGPSALDDTLNAEALKRLDDLLDRRIETRKPLAYLLGEAWFAGLKFRVDEHTLIPRSPLAELILGGIQPWLELGRALKVLDIGTGSGCIAAALAWHWPALEVDAVDVSPKALAVARDNMARLGLGDRVRLIESDLFRALANRQYDLIIANPPYVPDSSMRGLPEEYRHEPALALAGGEDGLDIVRRLLADAAAHLTPDGILLLEVGEARPQTERLLDEIPALWLEFEHGGEGVALLDRPACLAWADHHREEARV